MKKSLLATTVLLLASVCIANAESITKAQAIQVAQNFISDHSTYSAAKGTNATYDASVAESTDGHYVINTGSGFVVVAADDAVPQQVLGYSMSGNYNVTAIPEGLKDMLNDYDRQIASLKASGAKSATSSSPVRETILLNTPQWNQNSPYNNLCPLITDGLYVGTRCATGCGATALAEIMYYHQWPQSYNWNILKPAYKDDSEGDSCQEVAKLMSDIGAACNMEYGVQSNTNDENLISALVKFGYSSDAVLLFRSNYTADVWEEMVYRNLQEYGPLQYNGYGHAFVCDGYKEGYFHFNWGWGGISNDAFFLLTAITPDSSGTGANDTNDYTPYQRAIFNIHPDNGKTYTWRADDTPTTEPNNGVFELADISYDKEVEIGSSIQISGVFKNPTSAFLSNDIAILLLGEEGDTIYHKGTDVPFVTVFHAESAANDTCHFNTKIQAPATSGKYTLHCVNRANKTIFERDITVKEREKVTPELTSGPDIEFVDDQHIRISFSLSDIDNVDSIKIAAINAKTQGKLGIINQPTLGTDYVFTMETLSKLTVGTPVMFMFVCMKNGSPQPIGDGMYAAVVSVFTGIKNVSVDKTSCPDGKYIDDSGIYIIHNGKRYDTIGR